MKKAVLALLFMTLILGMLFGSAIVKADGGNNSGSNSGDSDLDSEDDENTSLEEDDTEDEENFSEMRERIRNRENVRKEFSRNITTVDGKTIIIERKVEVKDGEVKIKIKKVIIFADGTKTTIEIEIERDENGTVNQVGIQGENVNVDENIEINDLFEENESELEAVLSDGNTTKIKILPERVRELVRERLRTINISNLTLEEIKYRNIPRVVYNVETNQNGRFLGIFKLALKSETQIDPATGEILDVNRPWWAFLVSVPDEEASGSNETNSGNESGEEFVCCKVEAVVPEPVLEYMLLSESECDDFGDNGEPILGAMKTIADDSFCE